MYSDGLDVASQSLDLFVGEIQYERDDVATQSLGVRVPVVVRCVTFCTAAESEETSSAHRSGVFFCCFFWARRELLLIFEMFGQSRGLTGERVVLYSWTPRSGWTQRISNFPVELTPARWTREIVICRLLSYLDGSALSREGSFEVRDTKPKVWSTPLLILPCAFQPLYTRKR
jgi:hypothetical protein